MSEHLVALLVRAIAWHEYQRAYREAVESVKIHRYEWNGKKMVRRNGV